MKCSLGIPNFLEQLSSLSHSIVFLYFFALIAKEGFLISTCYSLKFCIQMGISLIFSLAFHFSSFYSYCKTSSDSHFAFLHFFFSGMVLIPASCTISRTSIHSSSGTWSIRSNPLNLLFHFYCIIIRDLFRSYLNSLVVFPTFFNLSLNLAIRSSWSEPQSAPSLGFADCIELLHLWLQRK